MSGILLVLASDGAIGLSREVWNGTSPIGKDLVLVSAVLILAGFAVKSTIGLIRKAREQSQRSDRISGSHRVSSSSVRAALVASAAFACGCFSPSGGDAASLAGHYELFVGSGQLLDRKDFESAQLHLAPDGTFALSCTFSGNRTERLEGRWTHTGSGVHFDRFVDCVGIFPPSFNEAKIGANLIVERSNPPTIVMSPDVNVFFEKVDPGEAPP